MKKILSIIMVLAVAAVSAACVTGCTGVTDRDDSRRLQVDEADVFGKTEQEDDLPHGENGYIIEDGIAQPMLQYSNYLAEDYSNEDSDILRYCVWVETDNDTDNDGKADLVKAFIQVPRAAAEGKYKAAVIYDPTPYSAGIITDVDLNLEEYSDKIFDYDLLYKDCEKRNPTGDETDTIEQALNENPWDWNYIVPHTGAQGYSYGQLYDYYLIRGFAVVNATGIGTFGSEGYELCGFDLERDSHRCVVEWLTGDRVAFTSSDATSTIKADWCNGKVAMTGCSYGGTLPYEVATTGVKGLETIIPFAGIASWYDYTNSQGATKYVNGSYADWLASYNGGGLFLDDDWTVIDHDYAGWMWQIANDQNEANGDYTDIWARIDYSHDYENIRCSALIVHGLNDYNVTTKQADLMYQAFKEAGATAKLVFHQDGHNILDGNIVDGRLWQEIMNGWLCHYLLGTENGAEDMAEVTYQSNIDGEWHTADSWRDFNYSNIEALCDNDQQHVTSSKYEEYMDAYAAGVTTVGFFDQNFKDEFYINIPKNNCAVYELDIPEGSTIYGVPEIHFKAAPTVENLTGLQTTAVLVDTIDGDESFDAYMTKGQLHNLLPKITYDCFDVGGGYGFSSIHKYVKSYTKAKVLTQGWMDLSNPGCGYDSREYLATELIKAGKTYDYTFYMMPTVYTLQPGHKLSLVITTYDPFQSYLYGQGDYEDYGFIIDNASLDIKIPMQ